MEPPRRSILVAPASEAEELCFELDYLRSLTFDQRLAMVRERSREMLRRMIERGHRKPFEIVVRP